MIGTVHLPDRFYYHLRRAPLLVIELPLKDRIKRLVHEYGQAPDDILRAAFERIRKKLGGQHLKAAFEALDKDDRASAAAIALAYYDKAYNYDLTAKDTQHINFLPVETDKTSDLAAEIIDFFEKHPAHTWTINA
jgi:tRNA 2-selenouridine synthase